MSGEPYPKASQLARGERRYIRKVASPKRWQSLRAAKVEGRACRLCATYGADRFPGDRAEHAHHLVPRSRGGDDVADNLVGLCWEHHALVEQRNAATLHLLARNLSDAEYAYVIGKLGEGGMERLFGVGRS